MTADVIAFWAWRDPDAALAAAEAEPPGYTRRELIDRVSRAWAYQRPDRVERALRNQDNAVRRAHARGLAADELAWRRAGNPPRLYPELVPAPGRPLTPAEVKALREPGDPVNRVVDDPGSTAWLRGPDRLRTLQRAAMVSIHETGRLDGVYAIVAGLEDPAEAEGVLGEVAKGGGGPIDLPRSIELPGRVKDPRRFIDAACWAVAMRARPRPRDDP